MEDATSIHRQLSLQKWGWSFPLAAAAAWLILASIRTWTFRMTNNSTQPHTKTIDRFNRKRNWISLNGLVESDRIGSARVKDEAHNRRISTFRFRSNNRYTDCVNCLADVCAFSTNVQQLATRQGRDIKCRSSRAVHSRRVHDVGEDTKHKKKSHKFPVAPTMVRARQNTFVTRQQQQHQQRRRRRRTLDLLELALISLWRWRRFAADWTSTNFGCNTREWTTVRLWLGSVFTTPVAVRVTTASQPENNRPASAESSAGGQPPPPPPLA